MKGSLIVALQQWVVARSSEDTWREIIKAAGQGEKRRYTPLETVHDAEYLRLIAEAGDALRLTPVEIWEGVADHWIGTYTQKTTPFYFDGHNSSRSFLIHMNDVHRAVGRATSNSAEPPSFTFQEEPDGSLLIRYHSQRKLMPYFLALLKAVGKHFKETLIIRQIDETQVRVIFG